MVGILTVKNHFCGIYLMPKEDGKEHNVRTKYTERLEVEKS